jgi:predicted nucleic acid-binding protein
MAEPNPRLYLDTNILVSYIHEREDASVNLINRIRLKKWECITSSFTALEIYDIEQLEVWVQHWRVKHWMFDQIMRNYSRRRSNRLRLTSEQLIAVHTTIHDALTPLRDCIQFILLNDAISTAAEHYCSITNIGATDALHLATAWYTGCDILVTNDDDFLAIVRSHMKGMIATKAKDFNRALDEYLKLDEHLKTEAKSRAIAMWFQKPKT